MLACEGEGKGLDVMAYFVAYTTVMCQGFILGGGISRKAGRIVEWNMDHRGFSRKDRASLMGMTADRHDVVEFHAAQVSEGFRFVS